MNKTFKQYGLYLNNIVLSWPEDVRLTAETCGQELPSCKQASGFYDVVY